MTQKQLRQQFWQFLKEAEPHLYMRGKRSKRQNDQITDIRCAFVQWMDDMYKSGQITEKQVNTYTL